MRSLADPLRRLPSPLIEPLGPLVPWPALARRQRPTSWRVHSRRADADRARRRRRAGWGRRDREPRVGLRSQGSRVERSRDVACHPSVGPFGARRVRSRGGGGRRSRRRAGGVTGANGRIAFEMSGAIYSIQPTGAGSADPHRRPCRPFTAVVAEREDDRLRTGRRPLADAGRRNRRPAAHERARRSTPRPGGRPTAARSSSPAPMTAALTGRSMFVKPVAGGIAHPAHDRRRRVRRRTDVDVRQPVRRLRRRLRVRARRPCAR